MDPFRKVRGVPNTAVANHGSETSSVRPAMHSDLEPTQGQDVAPCSDNISTWSSLNGKGGSNGNDSSCDREYISAHRRAGDGCGKLTETSMASFPDAGSSGEAKPGSGSFRAPLTRHSSKHEATSRDSTSIDVTEASFFADRGPSTVEIFHAHPPTASYMLHMLGSANTCPPSRLKTSGEDAPKLWSTGRAEQRSDSDEIERDFPSPCVATDGPNPVHKSLSPQQVSH